MGWLDGVRPKPAQPANPYAGLRQQALTLDPATIGLQPSPQFPQVFVGLMEMGMEGGVATLVVIADGTTSLYWSTGGGIIGAGFHEPVKQPSKVFLATLERHTKEMREDDASHPLPANGMINLRARTFAGGCLIASASSQDFAEKRHPLWDAFYAGNAVITVMRQLPSIQKSQLGR
ncbi:MAG TPA: hypothetical protein VFR68_07765 [Candidatus Dormibacteraeota bacterium]|nr:hypothetical protein [Candidatus Dormibacteraeota bacterium]